MLTPWKKSYDQSRQHIKKQKVHLVKTMIFPVVMYGWESWTIKKAERQRTDAFELWCWRRLLRVPWIAKEIHPKGDQSWVFIGRIDVEAEAPILWSLDGKSWLIGKDPASGKDWRQEEGMTEDELVGWHHWLSGHEFEQAPGCSAGELSKVQHTRLSCSSPSPRVCSNSCPLSQWCHPTISPPSPPAFNLSQYQYFPMS